MLRILGRLLGSWVMLAVVALAAFPAAATSKLPRLPSCSSFQASAISKAIGVPNLRYWFRASGNSCFWRASKAGHYYTVVGIEVHYADVPIYLDAKAETEKYAQKDGDRFGTIGSRGNPWRAAFFRSGIDVDTDLGPCPPGHVQPPYEPPFCSTDPDGVRHNVYAINKSLNLMYNVAGDGELGDVYLSRTAYLEKLLMQGKIP